MAYFLWSLLTICASLLLVQIQLDEYHFISFRNSIIRFITIFFTLAKQWSFGRLDSTIFPNFFVIFSIALFCDLGEAVSNKFDELNDVLYRSEWNTFSIGVQRTLPIILMATQQKVVPRGFGNLICFRQSFKKVNIFLFHIFIKIFTVFLQFFKILSRLSTLDFHISWYSIDLGNECVRGYLRCVAKYRLISIKYKRQNVEL